MDKLETHKKAYKKTFDDPRRKREEQQAQIRKQQRDEQLSKRRQGNDTNQDEVSMGGSNQSGSVYTIDQIPILSQSLLSSDFNTQFEATQGLRRLLSREHNPPIQAVIDAGVIPRLVQFLGDYEHPNLQFEAAWTLTNISSGTTEQTHEVVRHGSVPKCVELLNSPKLEVKEQAIWTLGNIAGDSANCRDLVLKSGALQPILQLIALEIGSMDNGGQMLNNSTNNNTSGKVSGKTSILRTATWTVNNLCRGRPPPPFEMVSGSLSILCRLLYFPDLEVMTDACWALSYISDGPNDRVEAVLRSDACPRLVELLGHPSPLVQTPALRCVGNIVTGDDRQTQMVLSCGAARYLLQLLSSPKKVIRKEACWTVSNITAGNKEQIQEIIDNGLIGPLVNLLNTAEFDVKKEAAWAISNATTGGTPEQIETLVNHGVIKPLCDLLSIEDAKVINVALEAIENILKIGAIRQHERGLQENPYCVLVEQSYGLSRLEKLQEAPSKAIYEKAFHIIVSYFPFEYEDEQEEILDSSNNNETEFKYDPSQNANFKFE
ncbi:importin alpha [Cryptosporidium ryanae]|uniref:importin alpha n=1 Tax=Cryptosporidium ryanae TaxID=515981 RepID=UPI00351A4A62|nr:importin alpha [Cryptosporidium ryanae]